MCLRNPPEQPGRKRRGLSLATAGPPIKQPLLCFSPPRLTLGAEESVFTDPRGPTIAPRCPTAVIADKIKDIFKKRAKIFSAYHKRPALMQPVCTAISTLCHAGRGLAGHPRCVNVGNDYGKTRFAQICSKTIVLPRCARHHSAQRERASPPRRGEESAGKSSHRNRSSSPERVRLLQPLHPRPQKIRRPILDLRLLNYALMKRSFRVITLKQIFTQMCPADWFMSLDLKDVYFRIQVIQESMRFAFEVVAYQYKVLPFGLSLAPHIFTRCMDVALSPLRKMGIRILNYLDGFNIAQNSPPQPLRLPGAQGQLCQEHAVTQPTSFVPGHSYWLGAEKPRQFSATQPPSRKVPPVRSKLSRECWALWQKLRQYFSWIYFTCDPTSSGWSRGLHLRLGVTDATA